MANSVDLDQSSLIRVIWSGLTYLFMHFCLKFYELNGICKMCCPTGKMVQGILHLCPNTTYWINSIMFFSVLDDCLALFQQMTVKLLSLLIVPRLFEEKRRDTVFGFPWCVARGAWRVVHGMGAWCVVPNFSRYLVPLTPPTVFVRSFSNRCFKDGLKICMWFFQNPEIIFLSLFSHFELRHFLSSHITEVYREKVPCPLNSSHSFWPILLKLYMCF